MEELAEAPSRDLVADVLQSVSGERRLLRELRAALDRQRRGVAAGDAAAIEVASRAVASAVLTLDNARRRREQMMRVLSDGADIRLEHLDRVTGPIEGLAEARAALRVEAEAVIADLALTQDVLQGALRAGDAWLQSLFASVSAPAASYAPAVAAAPAGQLVNRRA
ncbi:MAG: hypothetical protein KC544_08675 [Gemmatimonadetes bacterium]|nr:hypothetical protein [Gemmatimonadota bacterium]MCB9518846.1 hypothetical protein [Gemmatimonadales bacterium]HRX19710.1 hypothetical protein [Gemmatimonadales bacterium]